MESSEKNIQKRFEGVESSSQGVFINNERTALVGGA